MDIKKNIVRNFLYPFIISRNGTEQELLYNRYLSEHEYDTTEQMERLQRQKLSEVLNHAVSNITYYKQIRDKLQLSFDADSIYEKLERIPLLSKNIIRENFDNIHAELNGRWAYNTSGGSTGEPVRFVQDESYWNQNCTQYIDTLGHYEMGDKLVRIWGNEKEIIENYINPKLKIYNFFFVRTRFLNSFSMGEEEMINYVNKINSFRPKVIIAYAQSIYEIARFVERKKLKIHNPDSVISCAGTLYPEFREKIGSVLGCHVFNRYGSREVGGIAMECDCHTGLHLMMLNNYVEILDEDGNRVPDGKEGEIVVTTLTNKLMPLIRYRIGDMGIMSTEKCACGRGWKMLKTVTGRTVNVFRTKSGKLIDGEYFTHLFYYIDFVLKFQVIQENYEEILVRIKLASKEDFDNNKNVFDDMTQKIKLVMGSECKVRYDICDDIKPSSSGKFLYTISNIKN